MCVMLSYDSDTGNRGSVVVGAASRLREGRGPRVDGEGCMFP